MKEQFANFWPQQIDIIFNIHTKYYFKLNMYVWHKLHSVLAFTQQCYLAKTERFVVILPVRLHENDENAHVKWRLLNPETQLETLNTNTNFSRVKDGKTDTYFWYRRTLAFILTWNISKSPTSMTTCINTKLHFLQHIVLNFKCLPKTACPHSMCIINFCW